MLVGTGGLSWSRVGQRAGVVTAGDEADSHDDFKPQVKAEKATQTVYDHIEQVRLFVPFPCCPFVLSAEASFFRGPNQIIEPQSLEKKFSCLGSVNHLISVDCK